MKRLLTLSLAALLAAGLTACGAGEERRDWLGAAIPVEMLRCRKSRCSTSTRRRRWG